MFLPTKAHMEEILRSEDELALEEQGLGHLLPQGKQYKVRIGNQVPKDAVNLAYVHVPSVHSEENVLVTDLSNTILENTRNAQSQDIYMYPDQSLLLHTEDGQFELATSNVSMTNVFAEDTPLYYAHTLSYLHYDNKGPDEFGMYEGNGITIVNRKGLPISRPYRIQLLPTEYSNLYTVNVFTSFNDTESDTYQVVYNAVKITAEGRTETISGFSEKLNLSNAFEKVHQLSSFMPMVGNNTAYPLYYQANGANPEYSKFYVPTPPIRDRRQPQYFRYQVGVEIDIKGEKMVFTTPWQTSSVLNVSSLIPSEQEEYINGSRQVTEDTAETIMRRYVGHEYLFHIYSRKRYFVICNNDKVKMFTRIDGSSPISARTDVDTNPIDGEFKVPLKSMKTEEPALTEGIIFYKIRPIKGPERTTSYVSFVIDGSRSIKRFDPDGGYRRNLIESITQSGKEFYGDVLFNGYYYKNGFEAIQDEFTGNTSDFLQKFDDIRNDDDITRPTHAIEASIASFDHVRNTYRNKAKKTIVLLTDGEYLNFQRITEQIELAKDKDISLCIVTFNRFAELYQICQEHGVLCIDANSSHVGMDLRYFFFELAGLEESEYLVNDLGHVINRQFSMTPNDNDLEMATIDAVNTNGIAQYIPQYARNAPDRYGIEILLKDATGLGAITEIDELPSEDPARMNLYILDVPQNRYLPSINGTDIISIQAMQVANAHKVFVHSTAYTYHFNHTYAVRMNDTQQIRILPPREKEKHLSWYPRIKNGRFERMSLDNQGRPVIYSYSTPEYYKQDFIEDLGVPYIRVRNERPKVLNDYQIKVMYHPLYIVKEGQRITNVEVTVNGKPIDILSWHTFDGIFDLDGVITPNDDILISYDYEEDSYVYRGYFDEKSNRFWSLDLNPSAGHYVTIRDRQDGEIKDIPSFTLINETIYLYLRPTAKFSPVNFKAVYSIEDRFQEGVYHLQEPALLSYEFIVGRIDPDGNEIHLPHINDSEPGSESYVPQQIDEVITGISIQNPKAGTYFIRYAYMSDERRSIDGIKPETLFHTFDQVDDEEAILIGQIHVRPNSNQSSIEIIDTRVRGGGLKPEITEDIMAEFEEESKFYWDIGYWDGQPYSENAVVVFRLSRRILKEYGGRFTKEEVEEKLNKHFSYGSLPIIEFIEDSDELLQIPEDLVLEVIDVDDSGEVTIEMPTFRLELEG